MNLTNYDWKKAAAQVIDDGTVERAFMDQAYGFLANKAGKLMRDPHRLGFEVVYKNDTNTRMVGIFAFRVNDTLIYVPVFFLNGEIKGTDLMYRQETKTFVPLNEEWVQFLTEKNNYEPGNGISRTQYGKVNNHVRFEDIAYPPNYKKDKRASEDDTLQTYNDLDSLILNSHKDLVSKDVLAELLNKVASAEVPSTATREVGALLRQFLVEDGGIEAVAKIASWMESSFEFTEALVTALPENAYMPEAARPLTKKAAAPDNSPTLVLYTGRPGKTAHSDLLKSAADSVSDKFFSKGYYLWDDRAPTDVVPVYKDSTEEMEMVGEAGVYDVLMRDGTFKKAVVAPSAASGFTRSREGNGLCYSGESLCYNGDNEGGVIENIRYGPPTRGCHTVRVVCLLDGDKESSMRSEVYGKFIKDGATMLRDEDLKSTATAGNAYRVYDAESGTISEAFYVESVKDVDGVKFYNIVPHYGCDTPISVKHNPDIRQTDLATNLLGSSAYFIPVSTSRYKHDTKGSYSSYEHYDFFAKEIGNPDIGTRDSIDDWVMDHVKKASILYDDSTNTYSWRDGPREQTSFYSRIPFAVKLAQAGIHAESVEELLDDAARDGSRTLYYGDPTAEKNAYTTRVLRDAMFSTDRDSNFDVASESPQSFVLKTKTEGRDEAPQRVGDAYDPGMGRKPEDGMSKDQLMSMSPDQISQFATSNEMPNVFEHGLVGSLVQVYDSMSMIDKYIPDLEEALDRQGRILFLFYWKPRDFEDAYGSDDMTNLENQILSNFKSFGSLVLDLMKRSKKRKLGNVSLGS